MRLLFYCADMEKQYGMYETLLEPYPIGCYLENAGQSRTAVKPNLVRDRITTTSLQMWHVLFKT